ncbi:MAG: B12-binding domain-containing radical SAM protein [Candidatus Riflebacteria bacterium]|nr:B12-binding domain-containing radical SAM protein [Candidatus Riflebacteria bacterium]
MQPMPSSSSSSSQRILLVQPPIPRTLDPIVLPPLGLGYLASAALAHGYENVQILDAPAESLDHDGTVRRIRESGPWLVIGITATTPTSGSAERLAVDLHDSGAWLVQGGPHLSASFAEDAPSLLRGFHLGIPGEAEETFVTLLDLLKDRNPSDIAKLEFPAGVYYPPNSFRRNEHVISPDMLRAPARHLFPTTGYRYPLAFGRPFATVFSSRGCPFHCTFCDHSTFGRSPRFTPMKDLLAELEDVIGKGAEYIVFFDDLFTFSKERVQQLCKEIIRRKWNIRWKCEGRVDTLDREMLDLMKKAGCECIAMGIESANPLSLRFLGKRTRPAQALRASRMVLAAGIRLIGYFILGIPGETWEDSMRTVRWARFLRCDYAQFSILSPMPGTPLKKWAIANNCYREIPAMNPFDLGSTRAVLVTGSWTPEALQEIVSIAHSQFYGSFGYICRRILGLRSFAELRSAWLSVRHLSQYLSQHLFPSSKGK